MTFVIIFSCKPEKNEPEIRKDEPQKFEEPNVPKATSEQKNILENKTDQLTSTPDKVEKIPDDWEEITVKKGITLDIKYADDDNFTKKQIYDCGRCFLRKEVAAAIRKVGQELQDSFGYSLKLFDCFRPQPFQQKLWDAVPDPNYVTPPAKGSMHSRGQAIDLTIIDVNGDELDMGTPFDFLGEKAHMDFKGHTPEVYKNRQILKRTMEKYGFKGIRTEWWHFSYRGKTYPLDEWVWACE